MKSVLNGLFRSNSLSVSVCLSLSLSLSVRPTFCKVFEEEFSLVRNAWLDDFITRFQLSFLVLLFFSLRFALRLRREKKAWRGECTRAEFVPVAAAFSFPACASSVLFFFYVFAYMRFPTAATGLRDLFDVDYGEQPVPRNEGGRDFHSAALPRKRVVLGHVHPDEPMICFGSFADDSLASTLSFSGIAFCMLNVIRLSR